MNLPLQTISTSARSSLSFGHAPAFFHRETSNARWAGSMKRYKATNGHLPYFREMLSTILAIHCKIINNFSVHRSGIAMHDVMNQLLPINAMPRFLPCAAMQGVTEHTFLLARRDVTVAFHERVYVSLVLVLTFVSMRYERKQPPVP